MICDQAGPGHGPWAPASTPTVLVTTTPADATFTTAPGPVWPGAVPQLSRQDGQSRPGPRSEGRRPSHGHGGWATILLLSTLVRPGVGQCPLAKCLGLTDGLPARADPGPVIMMITVQRPPQDSEVTPVAGDRHVQWGDVRAGTVLGRSPSAPYY
jgi:hypothetical protein